MEVTQCGVSTGILYLAIGGALERIPMCRFYLKDSRQEGRGYLSSAEDGEIRLTASFTWSRDRLGELGSLKVLTI